MDDREFRARMDRHMGRIDGHMERIDGHMERIDRHMIRGNAIMDRLESHLDDTARFYRDQLLRLEKMLEPLRVTLVGIGARFAETNDSLLSLGSEIRDLRTTSNQHTTALMTMLDRLPPAQPDA
jgi:hypothetical protein